jgi:hypothetical protein
MTWTKDVSTSRFFHDIDHLGVISVNTQLMDEIVRLKVKKVTRLFHASAVTIALTLFGSSVAAQPFDPFSQDGSRLSANVMAMHWLGLEQGVVESCNGDVAPNGQKLIDFLDAAELAYGEDYAATLGSLFWMGLRLGQGIGCDVDAMRIYGSWADLYYDPALSEFRQ